MGTRGVTGFVANGKWYVTYNHFDSYPEYLGMHVLEFCKAVNDWDALKTRVSKVKLVDESKKPTKAQIAKYSRYSDTSVSNQTLEDWYCLLRNLQGDKILYEIALGRVKHMIDSHMFMADSLFCEWGYIIDLDEMGLRVYKGFNQKEPSPNKFNVLPPDINDGEYDEHTFKNIGEKYYPVKLLYTYNLNKLPEFMLGVTNEFKKEYRERHKVVTSEPAWENFY